MISVRLQSNGLDAVRAYEPNRMYYSGFNGVLALMAHALVEIVYERVWEPRYVYDAKGRMRIEWRDRSNRSAVPVTSEWYGARKRRMLCTRDFGMLNTWGGPVFGFRPPKHSNFGPRGDGTIVVWDCLWHDWRRISIVEPVSVVSVIPTTLYPGVNQSKVPDDEGKRFIEMEKQIAFRIFAANFHERAKVDLFRYMDNRLPMNLQFQEENLRKQLMGRYEEEKKAKEEELRKIEEAEKLRQEKEKMEAEEKARKENEEAAEAEAKAVAEEKAKSTSSASKMAAKGTTTEITDGKSVTKATASLDADKKVSDKPIGMSDGSDDSVMPINGIVNENGIPVNNRRFK